MLQHIRPADCRDHFLSDHIHILTGPRLPDILNTPTACLCLKYHMASSWWLITGHLSHNPTASLIACGFVLPSCLLIDEVPFDSDAVQAVFAKVTFSDSHAGLAVTD
jgi:hypothetical protein